MVAGTSTLLLDAAGAAKRAVTGTIKARARRYARSPQALESLHPGLGCVDPATLVAVAAALVEREARSPRRWFGFGGEVSLINARAALLLGRTLRRQGGRGAREEPSVEGPVLPPRARPGGEA